jgi:hypothetical protein
MTEASQLLDVTAMDSLPHLRCGGWLMESNVAFAPEHADLGFGVGLVRPETHVVRSSRAIPIFASAMP